MTFPLTIDYMINIVGEEAVKELINDSDGYISGHLKLRFLSAILRAYGTDSHQQGRKFEAYDLRTSRDPDPEKKVFIIVGPPRNEQL